MITVIWRSQTSPYKHTPQCSHYLPGTRDARVLSVGNFSHGAPPSGSPSCPGPRSTCSTLTLALVAAAAMTPRSWVRLTQCSPGGSDGKKEKSTACHAGGPASIPGPGRSLREGNGYSSILAWKIPRTDEPGRLQYMGLQKSQTRLSNETTTTNRDPQVE